jgi:hypothetical protein
VRPRFCLLAPRHIDTQRPRIPMLRFTNLLLLAAALLAPTACTSTTTALDDCYDICDRYRSCFDSKYKVGDCYNRCGDAQSDRYFVQDTEDCRSCFLSRSCSSADFNCSTRCDWIVP